MSRPGAGELRRLLRLYLVTDPVMSLPRRVEEAVDAALSAGVRAVQLRDKRAGDDGIALQGSRLLASCRRAGALLLIDDYPLLAARIGADGVHVGASDTPAREARRIIGDDMLLGVSVRTPAEALDAEAAGADYVAANGVFPTATKTDLPSPLGLEGVAMLREATALPLLAIGGIDEYNAASVIAAGADGIAVVSAVMAAADPARAAARLLEVIGPSR